MTGWMLLLHDDIDTEGDPVRPEFRSYTLTPVGQQAAQAVAQAFDELLAKLENLVPPGRQLALVKTELERACFHAKKGVAEAQSEATP